MEKESGKPRVEYQADWDGIPEGGAGVPSCADRLVQALLETLLSIIMEIKGRPDAAEQSFENGTLLGHLDATVKALTMALEHLELSPYTRHVAEHVLKKGTLPEDLASMK